MDKERQSKRSGPWVALVALLGVMGLPVLYVLSLGPASWMYEEGYLSPGMKTALEYIYSPLVWVAENWDWAGGILIAYVMWWAELGS